PLFPYPTLFRSSDTGRCPPSLFPQSDGGRRRTVPLGARQRRTCPQPDDTDLDGDHTDAADRRALLLPRRRAHLRGSDLTWQTSRSSLKVSRNDTDWEPVPITTDA